MIPIDTAKIHPSKEISRSDILLSIVRLPNSEKIFTGSSDSKIYAFDLAQESAAPTTFEGHTSYVTGLALSSDRLVSGSYDGHLIWWDIPSGKKIRSIKAHSRWIRKVRISPDNLTVASVADDMVCRIWNLESGELQHELRGHQPLTPQNFSSMLYACAFSHDGQHLATADRTGHIIVWNLSTTKPAATLEAPELYTWDGKQRIRSIGGPRSLAFSPDNSLLAVGGVGQIQNVDGLGGKTRVEVFLWQKQERAAELASDKYKGLMQHLAFHPEGAWLLGAGGEGKGHLIFYDVPAKKIIREESAPMHVHDFVLNESSSRIYLAGHQKLALIDISSDIFKPT